MTNCTTPKIEFSRLKRRKVEAEFSGGEITSDGGALLLREADRQLGLMSQVADTVEDHRRQDMVQHSMLSILQQRVYGIALGYEDLNDHQELRKDSAIQTAVDRLGWCYVPLYMSHFVSTYLRWDKQKNPTLLRG